MLVLKSIGIALVGWIAGVFLMDLLGASRDVESWVGLFVGAASGLWFYFRPRMSEVVAQTAKKYQAVAEEVGARLHDDDDAQLYALAEAEVDAGTADPGLWSQALISAKGNEAMRKVEYLKLRARQLRRARHHQGQS